MKYLFLFFGLLTINPAQGQTKRFFDNDAKEVDSVGSYYYTLTVKGSANDSFSSISYYTKTNTLYYNEGLDNASGSRTRTYYYPDGVIKLEGLFKYGNPAGELKSYYSNGRPQSDLIFEEIDLSGKNDPVIGIINVWDSLANQIITSGNGICNCQLAPFLIKNEIETGKVDNGVKVGEWKGRISEVADFVESYNDGVLVRGVQHYEGQDFEYTRIEVRAEPIGGSKSFYEFVGKKMKYPTRARRKGIEGRVFIEFVVDKEGNLTNGRVVKGIDEECDQEALNAVMASPKWRPGYRRGRPAKRRYTLPLIFKLH